MSDIIIHHERIFYRCPYYFDYPVVNEDFNRRDGSALFKGKVWHCYVAFFG